MKNLHIYDSLKIIDKRKLHYLIKELSLNLDFQLISLEINLISGAEIHSLNKAHLNHDYTTDIITFSYSSDKNLIDGEILISVDDARNNSKKLKVSLNDEIARLVIHGILHIVGYNDQIASEKIIMKRMENKLFSTYKFILL